MQVGPTESTGANGSTGNTGNSGSVSGPTDTTVETGETSVIGPICKTSITVSCFKEGTKILCNVNNKEKYILIEKFK